ncbi:ankyrin repeat-containing protein BDA1-like [Actinidia eriantha]|uniref:ankyrin repeat-containing protein BDA1-like n=1 Tax=Actinidia eriantha TaxID=165200 RepID=UPI00258596E8|nr:ankyrin repeat-containing protein BDA1-like [Actinidia eriantha]
MEQRLCEAAIRGSVDSLHQLIAEDELILDKIVVGYFGGKSPLHVAASSGRTKFVKELLHLNPKLADVLDSRHQSALHIASAEGHVEMVRALTRVRPRMCIELDQEGRNPLHLAAMNGNVEVLKELIQVKPQATRGRVDGGETILHLCVKHNQVKALDLLLKSCGDMAFVNAKDRGGNSILHLAVIDSKIEMVKCVLTNSAFIDVNGKNESGHTAMDILFLARSISGGQEDLDCDIEDVLQQARAMRSKDLERHVSLENESNGLMVVASLIATIAFQAGVNPPGGTWQDDSNEHRAGDAIMAYKYPNAYPYFLHFNTIGFIISLSTILLLLHKLPSRTRLLVWIRAVIAWLTVLAVTFTYAYSITVITPKKYSHSPSHDIVVVIIVWVSLMSIFVFTRPIGVIRRQRRTNKAVERISKFGIRIPAGGAQPIQGGNSV